MVVKIIWTSRDWAAAVAELPVRGPLPCRTVLVPYGPVAHALRRELIRVGRVDALAGTWFLSAPTAAVEVLRSAGVEFEPGEEALRTARLSALFRSDLQLGHFPLDLLRSNPGWDAAFARSISDLEGAGLRPEDLESFYESERVRDLALIWRALDASAGVSWTIQRIYAEAAAALEAHPKTWPLDRAVLAFASGNLTASEARFFRAIPNATIGLLPARPTRERYLDRIEKLFGSEAGAILRFASAPRAAGSERDLLASYFFEPPAVLADPSRPRSAGPDGTVDLEEHAGLEAELDATADWVARQVAEGIPLEEIAVLLPNLDPLAKLVSNRLSRLPWDGGPFPVHVAGGLPLSGFAAGARALALIRALRSHLAANALADVLPSLRLADGSERHLSRGAAMDLIWSLGTVGGNQANPEGALEWGTGAGEREVELNAQLARAQNGDAAAKLARRAQELERLIADLRAIRPALDALVAVARAGLEKATLSILWPMLCAFLDQWLLQPPDGPPAHAVLDDRLGKLASDEACGSLVDDNALSVVEEAILSARVSIGRFGDSAVHIGEVRDALGVKFTAVRVIGLAEGHLPSVSREDPVVPDLLREKLRTAAGGSAALVPTAVDRALEDLHALDMAIRNAERRVALSAPRLDTERSQREPSSVILEAAAALGRPNRATGEPSATIPDRVGLERDAFAPAREGANRFRRELPLSEAAWQDGIAHGALGLPRRWRGVTALDLDSCRRLLYDDPAVMDGILGHLMSHLPVPGLSPNQPISPSAIEQLLTCPHAFLLGQLLQFEELVSPPPRREIGQPAYGLLFHAVAAEFYAANGADFGARQRRLDDWIAIADGIADKAFQEFLKGYPLVGDTVRKHEHDRLRRDLRDLIEYDWAAGKEKRFIAAEKAFGWPRPVELRTGETSLYIRGRIDRIDIEQQRCLVRDLKTGRAYPRSGNEAEPEPVRDIQIAVYGLVAEHLAEEWKVPKRIAVAYAYFGRGGSAERSFREDFHEALQPAARTWINVAARLLAERLFPRTPRGEDCTYCPFRPVCGDGVYERATSLLSKSDGVLADFNALKGGGEKEN